VYKPISEPFFSQMASQKEEQWWVLVGELGNELT